MGIQPSENGRLDSDSTAVEVTPTAHTREHQPDGFTTRWTARWTEALQAFLNISLLANIGLQKNRRDVQIVATEGNAESRRHF